MKVINDNLWLCTDCTIAAVNNDISNLSPERANRIDDGLKRLGPNLTPSFDQELFDDSAHDTDAMVEFGIAYSRLTCSCCRESYFGDHHRFSLIDPDAPNEPSDPPPAPPEATQLQRPLNIHLLQEIRNWVLATRKLDGDPDESHRIVWDQMVWNARRECGTACCVAGYAALKAPPECVVGDSFVLLPGKRCQSIRNYARDVLGLTDDQATTLFDTDNLSSEVVGLIDALIEPPTETF